MTTFAQLKKNRKQSLENLVDQLNKVTNAPQAQNQKDDRIWQPTVDSTGNGSAIIRFLPAPGNEDVPFVRLFSHGFQGPGGSWYIENSRTTIGENDPLAELNQKLWNSGRDEDKETVRRQKRKLHFIANIYVVKDPKNPENEGKVFLFKFGKKIFDKLNDMMNPEFEDETPVNPFDLWEGANFHLKIRNVEGYRNYDKSTFMEPGPLFDDDEKMEEVWKQEHSLQDEIGPDKFRSYEDLQKKLNRVLGLDSVVKEPDSSDEEEQTAPPKREKTKAPKNEVSDDEDGDLDIDALLKDVLEE